MSSGQAGMADVRVGCVMLLRHGKQQRIAVETEIGEISVRPQPAR
jgi:hypothetical protein